jgi:hypothetical protein
MTERVSTIPKHAARKSATLVSQGFGGVPVIDESDCVIGFVSRST